MTAALFVLLGIVSFVQLALVSAVITTLQQVRLCLQTHNGLLLRLTLATEKSNAINEQSALVTAEAAGIVKRTEQAAVDRMFAQTPSAGGKH